MNVLWRKALADITQRQGRTLLMILGIMLGVLGVTAVNETSDLLGGAFLYSTDASAVPNIVVATDQLPLPVLHEVAQLPGIESAQQRTMFIAASWQLDQKPGDQLLQIFAYPGTQPTPLWPYQIVEGRMPGVGEIALDIRTTVAYPIHIGSTVAIERPDQRLSFVRVVGLARMKGFALGNALLNGPTGFMSTTGLQQVAGNYLAPPDLRPVDILKAPTRSIQLEELLVKTSDAHVEALSQAISHVLDQHHIKAFLSNWNYAAGAASLQLQVTGPLTVIQLLTLLCSLLVGAMIFNAVNTALTEQFKIIGTMKALGATRRVIIGSYLLTIIFYSIVGTVIGIELGLVSGYQLATHLASTVQYDWGSQSIPLTTGPLQVSAWVVLVSCVIGLLLPCCSALWPLWRAAQISVHDAIAAYGINGNRGPGGRKRYRVRKNLPWIPQTVWLGIRGIFRRRERMFITLLALTFSAAIFTAVQVTNDSLGAASAAYLAPYARPDMRIDFNSNPTTQPTQSVEEAIQRLPAVQTIVPVNARYGLIAQKPMVVSGIPAETAGFTDALRAGRWLRSADQNAIVINDIAALRLHLQIGQQVSMILTQDDTQTQPGVHTNFVIVGFIHDLSDLSGSADPNGVYGEAYTTLKTLNTLLKLPVDYAERLAIHTTSTAIQVLRPLQSQIRSVLRQARLPNSSVETQQELEQSSTNPLPTIYSLFYAVSILVALVGLLGLAHTCMASVLERRMEIGILRSLGASGWRVGSIFWIEGLILAVLACCSGLLLGIPAGGGLVTLLGTFMGPMDLTVHLHIIPFTLLAMIGVTGLASFVPIVSAARIRIRDSVRYE